MEFGFDSDHDRCKERGLGMDQSNHTLLIVFVALTGLSVFLQLCVFIIFIVALKKTATAIISAKSATDDFKESVIPVLHSTRELLERVSPQIGVISEGLAEIIQLLHKETKGVQVSVSEIMARVNRQSVHIDEIVTKGLNSVERAGAKLDSAIAIPVRQANGIVAAIKAIFETYTGMNSRQRKPAPMVTYAAPVATVPVASVPVASVPVAAPQTAYADVPVPTISEVEPKI
jgi:uncharacterized protein YoxC